jgi:hypothetical protein
MTWIRAEFLETELRKFHKELQVKCPGLQFHCGRMLGWFAFSVDPMAFNALEDPIQGHGMNSNGLNEEPE